MAQAQGKMVMAFAKVKSRSGVRALLAHNLRLDNAKNVDASRTRLNETPKWVTGINRAMLEYNKNLGEHKPRKNAVWAHEFVISGSREFMNQMSHKQALRYFNDSIRFFKSMYGDESLVIPSAHFDETSPHLHIVIQPMKDGKLNGKKFTGGSKAKMRQIRQQFHKQVASKHGLDYGEPKQRSEPTALQEHYRLVNDEIPALQAKHAQLMQDVAFADSELSETRRAVALDTERLDDIQSALETARATVSDLERTIGHLHDLKAKATEMTRDELVQAVHQIDSESHRPTLRR